MAIAVYERIGPSLSKLSKWFCSMQSLKGAYGGPIVHWWLCSFVYCGPGANWTYKGLIEGYLKLHRKTRNELWLKRAVDAGEYLVNAQMPDGTYKNSFFELNPVYGSSSVHEASVDLGLLSLAFYLAEIGESGSKYLNAAIKNAEISLYQRLWDTTLKTFRSAGGIIKGSYILNIMATVAQVFLELYSHTEKAKYRELVSSTLSFILRYQRRKIGSVLFGSFPQGLHDANTYAFYNARVISFLLDVYETLGEEKALEAAELCGKFLGNLERKNGGFAFFVDSRKRVYEYPRLTGGVADVITALLGLKRLSSHHSDFNEIPHIEWLLKFQDSVGGFRTGEGFHFDANRKDYKDLFHVCGWNDKVFNLLASLFRGHTIKDERITPMKDPCWIGPIKAFFIENESEVMIRDTNRKTIYQWIKGDNLAFVESNYLKFFTRVSPAQAQSISSSNIRSMIRSLLRT